MQDLDSEQKAVNDTNSHNSLKYIPVSGKDEVLGKNGEVLPYWQGMLDSIEQLGQQEFEQKLEKAQRLLRNDGATYNIYQDRQPATADWTLDLVPFIISSEAWAEIESGLVERAELFNLVLKDIYGRRDLVQQRIIPPEALFSYPGFLRPCDGIAVPGEHQLMSHAVDLARDNRGDFCVMADRTQSPSGAGYALENRTVMSRVFPSLYRESQVHRLAGFFQRFRKKLTSLSPYSGQPRIVVLTPGAHNETYFEHAFMANYLGFHLVQSGDLVVRDGYLWMKSFDGLNRVDVVLRRVDDSWCDPVELRGDSLLGVPGLLDVVRSGRVVIANPLGSGVLENPIFLRYLPDIAKYFLGRELRLQTVHTWWGGDPGDLSYIRANFNSLVIKPVYRGTSMKSAYMGNLSIQEQQAWLAKVEANPLQYVAQPYLNVSHLPSYNNHQLESRPAILRSFIAADETSYHVMAGGLTRVAAGSRDFFISNQSGSRSKDTWVLTSEPVVSETISENVSDVNRAERFSLPGRVVENLFWMGRYAERAEVSLRFLRTILITLNTEDAISTDLRRHLLRAVTRVTVTAPGFINAPDELFANPADELVSLVVDKKRKGSVSHSLNAMLYCSEETRELVSSDTLRVINDIKGNLSTLEQGFASSMASAPEDALDPLVTALMALSGLGHESMVRGIGWRFIQIGRRLERSLQTSRIIHCLLGEMPSNEDEALLVKTTLLCLENLVSYRRRYNAGLSVEACLDLVMMDKDNPRSLIFQLSHLYDHLSSLPQNTGLGNELDEEQRMALQAQMMVQLSRPGLLSAVKGQSRPELVDMLDKLDTLLMETSDIITDKFFVHREAVHQLVSDKWD